MTLRSLGPIALAFLAACGGSSGNALKEPIGETTRPAAPRATTPTSAASSGKESLEERAARLHKQAIIVDGHNDIPSVMFAGGIDIGKPLPKTHTDLPRLKSG